MMLVDQDLQNIQSGEMQKLKGLEQRKLSKCTLFVNILENSAPVKNH